MQNQKTIKDRFPDIYTKLLLADSASAVANEKSAEYQSLLREAMIELRRTIGITAKAFGALFGVSKGYVYLLEKGDRPWSAKSVEKILSHL